MRLTEFTEKKWGAAVGQITRRYVNVLELENSLNSVEFSVFRGGPIPPLPVYWLPAWRDSHAALAFARSVSLSLPSLSSSNR